MAIFGVRSDFMAKTRHKPFQTEKAIELGGAERRLLRLLQRNNTLTNLQLAEKANMSPPTCLRRVRELRAEGVIVGDVSLVDPFKVGKSLIVIVEIVLERMQEHLIVEFENKIRAEPAITQCYAISGDTDFLLIIVLDDMPAYMKLIRRLFVNDPNIRNFRSLFVLERPKFSTEIPIDQ